jgi:hypothetical protein
MLRELALDVPSFHDLMSIRISDLSLADRIITGLDSPSSPNETVGGYCFLSNPPPQLVAARLVRHVDV